MTDDDLEHIGHLDPADLVLLELCELDTTDPDRPTALCQHCGLRLVLWELDADGCCTECHDPDEQQQRNNTGFAEARAALTAARAQHLGAGDG